LGGESGYSGKRILAILGSSSAMMWRWLTLGSLGLVATPIVAQTVPQNVPAPTDTLKQLLRHGRERVQQQDWPGALAAYQQAAQLAPQNAAVFAAIGYIHTQTGDWPAALAAYQQAVTLSPRNADFHNALALGRVDLM
jgi:cytochrome c-type biogenesis protein CcmH/NrfG